MGTLVPSRIYVMLAKQVPAKTTNFGDRNVLGRVYHTSRISKYFRCAKLFLDNNESRKKWINGCETKKKRNSVACPYSMQSLKTMVSRSVGWSPGSVKGRLKTGGRKANGDTVHEYWVRLRGANARGLRPQWWKCCYVHTPVLYRLSEP